MEDTQTGTNRIIRGITTGSLSGFLEARGVYVALVVVILISAILSPSFFKFFNILNVLRAAAVLGIVSIGQTLVNLLASDHPYCESGEQYDPETDDVPFPEYLTFEDLSQTMADQLTGWLEDPQTRESTLHQLRRLKAEFAIPGASERAAEYVLQELRRRISSKPRTHFRMLRVA